jgi:hypothetical protein
MVSLLLLQIIFYLQVASRYILLFQQREAQSAMLEEAPGRVALLSSFKLFLIARAIGGSGFGMSSA